MDLAKKQNIILKLSGKDEKENEYYIKVINLCENIDITKLIQDYAFKNNIILNLDQKNSIGDYPLFWAVHKNNFELVEMCMNYANKSNIILEMNEKKRWKLCSSRNN